MDPFPSTLMDVASLYEFDHTYPRGSEISVRSSAMTPLDLDYHQTIAHSWHRSMKDDRSKFTDHPGPHNYEVDHNELCNEIWNTEQAPTTVFLSDHTHLPPFTQSLPPTPSEHFHGMDSRLGYDTGEQANKLVPSSGQNCIIGDDMSLSFDYCGRISRMGTNSQSDESGSSNIIIFPEYKPEMSSKPQLSSQGSSEVMLSPINIRTSSDLFRSSDSFPLGHTDDLEKAIPHEILLLESNGFPEKSEAHDAMSEDGLDSPSDIFRSVSSSLANSPVNNDPSDPSANTQTRLYTDPSCCTNCSTKSTPLWRRTFEGLPLCNACGLYTKLHGIKRPLSLKTDVIKKRNRRTLAKSRSSSGESPFAEVDMVEMRSLAPSSRRRSLHEMAHNNAGSDGAERKRKRISSAALPFRQQNC